MVSTAPDKENNFSLMLVRGPGGPRCGLRMHNQKTVARKSTVRKSPGTIQAMNSWMMDCLVCTAMIMRTTLGGITTPRVPPMATLPVLKAWS